MRYIYIHYQFCFYESENGNFEQSWKKDDEKKERKMHTYKDERETDFFSTENDDEHVSIFSLRSFFHSFITKIPHAPFTSAPSSSSSFGGGIGFHRNLLPLNPFA